jgi:ribonuclease Y
MNSALFYLIAIAAVLIAGFIFLFLGKRSLDRQKKSLEHEKKKLIDEAKREAESIKKEALISAKDSAYQMKSEAEKEIRERTRELNLLDKRLRQREEQIEKRVDIIERKENDFNKREKEIINRENKLVENEKRYSQLLTEQTMTLERLSGLTSEKAKQELMKRVEAETKFDCAKLIKKIEDEARENGEKKAKEIIGLAIQRYANDYVADATVSAVSLPNDEMKGRIIGREGRNIRAFESATGVDLVVDDTPEIVTLSAHDPVRREIARIALDRLIADGRIHPARIEEIAEKVKIEVENSIREEGEKAVFDLGLTSIHHDLVKIIGRLKYRQSYGQNILQHSLEVAYFAGMMASELGVDAKLAKRAGLLHDIGKALDHEMEGSHQEIGVVLARKYGESNKVINAILAHHGDVDPICIESALVAAADAMSAARPGARRESIENYLKRLEKLEEMAMSFDGVDKCYAIQAGREIRILVRPDELNDELSSLVAKSLARKIESEMTYPGQIKVTVIRESRYVDYAK